MDEKHTGSWDELLKQIGADPAPDAFERKRPAIETNFEPPAEIAPPAKAKPGDWNALAGALGVDAAAIEETAKPAKASAPPARSAATAEAPSKSERTKPDREVPRHATAGELESTFAEIEAIGNDFEEVEGEIASIDFSDEESGPEDDADSLSGEAARNAFDSLFSAGSFAALPPREKAKPARSPEARRGPQWRDEQDAVGREAEAPRGRADRSSRDRAFDEFDDDAGRDVEASGDRVDQPRSDEGEGAADDQRPRRRRRRGRGRGRGRGRDEDGRSGEASAAGGEDGADQWADSLQDAPSDDEEADSGDQESESSDADPPRRRRPRRRRRRTGSADDASERTSDSPRRGAKAPAARNGARDEQDEDDDDDSHSDDDGVASKRRSDDDDDEGELPRSSHKNIPTWAEAISVMVDVNLQARKDSPQRGSSRDRGGRGRGRGRGGRGRGA